MKKKMITKNAFYAQSGGVTAVINASACGVIETAKKHKTKIPLMGRSFTYRVLNIPFQNQILFFEKKQSQNQKLSLGACFILNKFEIFTMLDHSSTFVRQNRNFQKIFDIFEFPISGIS